MILFRTFLNCHCLQDEFTHSGVKISTESIKPKKGSLREDCIWDCNCQAKVEELYKPNGPNVYLLTMTKSKPTSFQIPVLNNV